MNDMNIEQARYNMIEQQIRPWDVLDPRVLELMLEVPREEFVPPQYRAMAFTDMEIPLGHGQVMLAPKLVGRMLQALNIRPDDTILEVGTGSGYVTTLLGRLGRYVYSVEIVPELKAFAEKLLTARGAHNITVDEGNAAQGWERRGHFDAIAVTGSLPLLPQALQENLNVGGRLFVVLGDAPVMEATLVTRVSEGEWTRESLFETVVPPLCDVPQPPRFSF